MRKGTLAFLLSCIAVQAYAADDTVLLATSSFGQNENLPSHTDFSLSDFKNTSQKTSPQFDGKSSSGGTENQIFSFGGVLLGMDNTTFSYDAHYFAHAQANPLGNQTLINNLAFQGGASFGGQLGALYHLSGNPYFWGLSASVMADTNNGQFSNFIFSSLSPDNNDLNFTHKITKNYNIDLAAIVGFDITPATQAYAKLGGTFAQVADTLVPIQGTGTMTISQQFVNTNEISLWGMLAGFGITHHLTKSLALFVEYDNYAYFTSSLATFTDFTNPIIAGQDNLINQRVNMSTSAFRAGLNLFNPDSLAIARYLSYPEPWSLYLGIVGGAYTGNFYYDANYFDNRQGGSRLILQRDITQQAGTLGGRVGLQYHFNSPYFVGLEISGMGIGSKHANYNQIIEQNISPANVSTNLLFSAWLRYNVDVVPVVGFDITTQSHILGRLGYSHAGLSSQLTILSANTSVLVASAPVNFFSQNQKNKVSGLVVGMSFAQDLNRWLSAFVEYDNYYYGRIGLNSYANFIPVVTANSTSSVTQGEKVQAHTILFGLNFNLLDDNKVSHTARETLSPVQSALWQLFIGGFGGYYDALYRYQEVFSTQQGANGLPTYVEQFAEGEQTTYNVGGQIGFLVRPRSSCFYGVGFSGSYIGEDMASVSAHHDFFTSGFLTNNFDVNSEFRLKYMLNVYGLVGTDITPLTHVYVKFGGSDTKLMQTFFINQSRVAPLETITFRTTNERTFWGYLGGFGLSRDFGDRYTAFVEYVGFYYPKQHLPQQQNISPQKAANTQPEFLDQAVRLWAYTARAGININFAL